MSRIQVLSEHLANQIAAGEVVERPASVVKELLENSLDAGASQIDIHVEEGGVSLLRVADNGEGMDGDDVLLSLERHATSKLRTGSNLQSIATLGFRGEALPSIASVSRMTILSRLRGQNLGTKVEIRYGQIQALHESGCAQGTLVEVRHLFGNMPVRKKFLKSGRTEILHIEETIKNHALAHPQIAFRLYVDGRLSLEYLATDLEKRTRQVFAYQDTLLSLAAEQESVGQRMGLAGFLFLPQSSQAARAKLRILVSKRPVQDAMIRHAVRVGMKGFLMKDYQPSGVLFLVVPPELVDINVHPAKREVRFRRGEDVHQFIARATSRAIQAYQQQLRGEVFSLPAPQETEKKSLRQPQPLIYAHPPDSLIWPISAAEESPPFSAIAPSSPPPITPAGAIPTPPAPPTELIASEAAIKKLPLLMPKEKGQFAGLRLIGQLFSLYLLCEQQDRFVLIDQHAAHERLLYMELRQSYLQSCVARQTLLLPAAVELSPSQIETLEQRHKEVEALGLETILFGGSTCLIKTLPAVLGAIDPGPLLREILDSLRGLSAQEASQIFSSSLDGLFASMACKAAIRAGNRLQPEEMLALLQQMEAAQVFSHCPHGRPVLHSLSKREVEKWFHRGG